MTTSNLPKTGVQAIVENVQQFLKDINAVNKAVEENGNSSAKSAQKAGALPKSLDTAGKSFDDLKGKVTSFIKNNVPLGDQLGGIIDQLAAIPLPVFAAVAAIVALTKAFLDLGARGAPLQELGMSFDRITASVGINSQKLLKDLQAASEGTIANFDLIKVASNALVGTQGGLGKSLGNTLPELLKIARTQADATGKSVNELFDNLVQGIKKGTPKLIESTGLVIDQKAAYQDYAKQLGIAVNQLSDTDKSMALLGATLDAGTASMNVFSGAVESNADKLDRQQATITNIVDTFAIAVQPAFGVVLDSTQKVLNIFQQLATAIAPIFSGIVSIVASVFGTIIDIITSIAQPIVNVISSIAPYIALAFQTIANILSGVGKVISGVVGAIVKFLKDVSKNFFGLDLDNLGPQLFNGAAAAFGSFANGIIAVANKLIFPAVIAIAQFIADFLIGFSPPKEGPLSVIDKGGENIMMAWLGGITGVSLDPVKKVAQEVNDALGVIGKQSIGQVNARLEQLDKALLPFQNRLDIIKAQFDALNEPAKAALDAISRETDVLQEKALGGDQGAIERLKVLDQQRQTIQDQVDLQQGLVDRAQIQLGLAQAQQAPERSLLNIRKAALDALAKSQGQVTSGAAGGVKEPKTAKEKAGAGEVTPAGAAGGVAAPEGGLPSVLDLIGGQDAVNAAGEGIQKAFMGAIDQSGLDEFAQNSLDLGSQIDRIKSVDIGAKITDKFKGLTDAFNPAVAGSIANVLFNFFNGTAENPNSIAGIINNVSSVISPVIDTLKLNVQTLLASVFDPSVEGSPASIIVTLAGGPDVKGSAASFFAALPDNVVNALGDLKARIDKDVFESVRNFFTSSDPGSLGDMINQAVGFFTGLPTRIIDALRGIGVAIYASFALPVIRAINGLIGLVETGIQGLINQVADFVGSIANALGTATPQFLKDAINQLHSAAGGVHFGRISEELPAFLQSAPLAGARGGIFSKGFMTVGERGTELMYNASKMGVVPHEITSLLTGLQGIMAQASPQAVMSGSTTNSTTNNSSFNFNGVPSDNNARLRYNYLRAGMR